MVLASNEWLNNCEDDKKSATANTTGGTATATATTTGNPAVANDTATASTAATTPATNSISEATICNNSTAAIQTAPASATATATTTTITVDNANNGQFGQEILDEPPSMINANSLKIMADNTNDESTLKDEIKTELEEIDNDSNEIDNDSNEIENNNGECPDESILNTSLSDNVVNSNTNTLQAPLQNPTNTQKPKPLSSPITPQALSSALQSVMNATSHNVNVSVANLPANFLSSLSLGMNANANNVLQQTAKLSAALCTVDPQSQMTNNIVGNNSSNLDASEVSESNGQAKIVLLCEANSHPFQTRSILLTPNIECKVGRLIAKSKASESNAIFDCKVLSRNHAVLWFSDDGKFWVKDTKSSNGTFINENKLGAESAELHFGDIVKFGVDVLENSRKEVHGCIIACVKLYSPDGRESISIDATTQRSQYSGEGRISFDELHRLNLYMQEASQREKVLKSKLFNIQNILDATRKNSALCWQSMITEDQLLHRIHSLEKKLQMMEKSVPESVLRNEVLKLLDDKNSYQHTAKEALRKVYQERCDAMQMLAKMESSYTTSDNECKILRDQIMNTKQSLQDVNARLLRLENEYTEFKEETERQQEAREQEEQRTLELAEQLRQRDLECEELRRKISELLLKRAELLDDEEQLQKQAIDKLDAAIADMDLGDDDDDDDDDDDEDDDDEADNEDDESLEKKERKSSNLNDSDEVLNGENMALAVNNNSSNENKITNQISPKSDGEPHKEAKQKVAKESTIMKWLQNSDMNKKAGSVDIFKAILLESVSSDEDEQISPECGSGKAIQPNTADNLENIFKKFTAKLHDVQTNLKELETELANDTNKATDESAAIAADDSDEEGDADDELIVKRNGKLNEVLAKDNKRYFLLKASAFMLSEAYTEISEVMKKQQQLQPLGKSKQPSPPPAISVQTQFQNYAPHKPSNSSAAKKLETQETLKPLPEANEEIDSDEDDDEEDDISDATTTRFSTSSQQTAKEVDEATAKSPREQQQLAADIRDYQQQITQLNDQLEQIENDSQNTLEIMQIECDAQKDKVAELSKLIVRLHDEKEALEQVISENKSNAMKSSESRETHDDLAANELITHSPATESLQITADASSAHTIAFEEQMREELAAINSSSVQSAEELIVYKERLEQMQNENMQLRIEIAEFKLQAHDYTKTVLLRRVLPYGVAMVAILIYFLATYF